MSRKWVVLILLMFVAIGFEGVLIWLKPKSEVSPVVIEKVSKNKETVQESNNTNLVHFRSEILGLEFDYPKSWGEISMMPTEDITNLMTVNREYLDGEDTNDNKHMVTLSFSQNFYIKIKLINDSYPGSFYPNAGALVYGSMDNFKELVRTRNICQYKIDFNRGVFHATELYNSCKKGIKESVVLSGQDGYDFEDYEIKRWGYKRLMNGYFDNLLLFNQVAFAQSHNLDQKMTIEEIKSRNGIDEAKYQKDNEELILLMDSIKTFQPPKPTSIVFKNVVGEDPNITTIRKYYYYLAVKELSNAYGMYQNKKVSFDEFKKWYGEVFNTNVYNVKKIESSTYKFDVDLYEDNQKSKKYRINMEVNNDKINTLSSEEITSDEVRFGNLLSYTRLKSDRNEIVLNDNGSEKIIESAKENVDFGHNIGLVQFFYNPRFSHLGNYLIYDVGVWEGHYSRVYDIRNKKFLEDPNSSTAYLYEISGNEKYLVNCGNSDFDGTMRASVYSFPDFKLKYDFLVENNYKPDRECTLKYGEKQNWRCDDFDCNLKDNIIEFTIESSSNVRLSDQIKVLMKYNLNEAKVIN